MKHSIVFPGKPFGALALGIAMLSATPAAAQLKYWGAIADSASTGDYGWSWRWRDERRARTEAEAGCRRQSGARDCKASITFANRCAALVQAESGGNYFVVALSEGSAAASAMASCRDKHQKCTMKFAYCSWREKVEGETD